MHPTGATNGTSLGASNGALQSVLCVPLGPHGRFPMSIFLKNNFSKTNQLCLLTASSHQWMPFDGVTFQPMGLKLFCFPTGSFASL